ncbi:hypothetical protein D3C75_185520 [compost metagenome]
MESNKVNYKAVVKELESIINGLTLDGFFNHAIYEAISAVDVNNLELKKDLIFIAEIISSKLNAQGKQIVYKDVGTGNDFSTKFNDDRVRLIDSLAPKIQCHHLRGRMYDMLWLYKKPRTRIDALEACRAYIQPLVTDSSWHGYLKDCYTRLVKLSQINSSDDICKTLEQNLKEIISSEEGSYLFCQVVAFITDNNLLAEDKDLIDRIIIKKIYQAKKTSDFTLGKLLLKALSIRLKNNSNKHKPLLNIAHARMLVSEAEHVDNLLAIRLYNEAIKFYNETTKSIKGLYEVDKEVKSIKAKIRKAGLTAFQSLTRVKVLETDIKEAVLNSKNKMMDIKSPLDSLYVFCFITQPYNKEEMISQARQSIIDHPLSHMFATSVLDTEGRVVVSYDGIDTEQLIKGDFDVEHIYRQLNKDMSIFTSFKVQCDILPSLEQMLENHYISHELIETICYQSALIPHNKVKLFTRAFMLGFEYDFSTAIHILAPHVEDLIRTTLNEYGEYTAFIEADTRSEEVSLRTLLDKEFITDIFDPNFVFELKMFMTSQGGPNLRNTIAHGLVNDDTSNTCDVVYLWWRVFRWVLLSVVIDTNEYVNMKNEEPLSI